MNRLRKGFGKFKILVISPHFSSTFLAWETERPFRNLRNNELHGIVESLHLKLSDKQHSTFLKECAEEVIEAINGSN